MFTPPEMWTAKENELEGNFRGYIWPKRFVADTQLHFTGNGRKQEQKFFPVFPLNGHCSEDVQLQWCHPH